MRTHGRSKRRTWRKLHLGVDPESGEIEAVALTENRVEDARMVESLLRQIDQPIDRGCYDKHKVYDTLNRLASQAVVPVHRFMHQSPLVPSIYLFVSCL